jgi:hypothetical protein
VVGPDILAAYRGVYYELDTRMYFEDPSPPYELGGLPLASGLAFNTATGRLAGIPNNADVVSSPIPMSVRATTGDFQSVIILALRVELTPKRTHKPTHTHTKILTHRHAQIHAQARAHAKMLRHIRTRTCTFTRIRTHAHTHAHANAHACAHTHMYTHMQTCTYTH